MRPVYGRSPWLDRFPKSKLPTYPKHRGDLYTDVAIIGGGLTGCATAYAFAAAGVSVALFEANRIGRGSTGSSGGWITDEPAMSFARLESALGRRAARDGWQAWRRAALDFQTLLRRLQLKCQLQPRSALMVAQTAEQAAQLTRERKARRDAGIDGVLMPAKSIDGVTGFASTAAMRTRDSATVDPYRTALGLAAAAEARGARIFERSPVTKTAFTREAATLTTGPSLVHASRIIVATGAGSALFKPLTRHFTPRAAYFVLTEPIPARVKRTLGSRNHLLRDSAEPAHHIAWIDDERLLVSGADGPPASPRNRDAVLVQRTGQLMYELSTMYPDISGLQPTYGWDAPYGMTAAGLPVIGPHRNFPHHLFAFADSSQSLTGAYLASRILLRHHLGEAQTADEPFGFGR